VMTQRVCFFVIGLLLAANIGRGEMSDRNPEYTMEVAFHPIRMSLADVSTLLRKVGRFLDVSGISSDNERFHNVLVLADGVKRFEISGEYSFDALQSAPSVSYELYYSFLSHSGAAVNHVEINFDDYRRGIKVSGTSQEQVEALAQLLRSEIGNHETYFGGPFLRLFGGAFVVMCSLAGFASRKHIVVRTLFAVLGVAGVLLVFGESLLPGTAIFKDSSSILVRLGPEISLLGVILSLAGIVVSFWLHRESSRARTAASADRAPNPAAQPDVQRTDVRRTRG
jgi:hypothetical protein